MSDNIEENESIRVFLIKKDDMFVEMYHGEEIDNNRGILNKLFGEHESHEVTLSKEQYEECVADPRKFGEYLKEDE